MRIGAHRLAEEEDFNSVFLGGFIECGLGLVNCMLAVAAQSIRLSQLGCLNDSLLYKLKMLNLSATSFCLHNRIESVFCYFRSHH